MVKERKRLPVGVENFEQIINDNYYYVDKTGLISELLRNGGMVNLFTRPRRFGKTLNMSMLEHFFSIEGEQSIFNGLEISKDTKLCKEYMGKYPVISISLKGINAATYETAFDFAVQLMQRTAEEFQFLSDSEYLSEHDKSVYRELLDSNMSETVFCGGLKILSKLLEKHYRLKVILLIDEYDVPLAKAFENGYYDQMIFLIRNLLEQALKTNNSLKFAVMTGCMRISKESIFTGLNNLKVLSITDERYDEYFGFTDTEVKEMLKYYETEDHYEEIKNWYDGYQFGGVEVYCPWDVLNYCDKLKDHADSFPENYWINTSSNDAVRKFIQMSDNLKTKREIETLLAGEEIIKEIHQELTYPEMYRSLENVWSLLFMTGYLTQRGRVDAKRYKLAIPNLEIRDIFETQIMEYFKESVAKDGDTLSRFCDALKNGEETKVGEIFESYLKKTISIRDTFVRKASKENFYHGILLGILGVKEEWYVSSNQESGEGYSDILVETENSETVILIEVKYANDGNLDQACERALQQIEEKKYDEELRENGVDKILKYGIACYMKRCKVKQAEK
ncbi:AAA family ATPase [Mediterraneibacter gnavus]|uniref:AAA family ATPase n=1 Tax=Mediterraneibacter gnavus TaxID=33038 RepID=A0AAJ3FBI6_MEDGN|nr:AAA family ATPase [Mediterraneibacter gnavus]MDU4755414.1 AAA family ATPase [Lachnospiraceae bacterium]NSC82101.1 AAA family ATPase [Mediterraneibacter gnavus]NSI25048.1 AAA family ATPase [Mediterraneibacter gnavus]NSI28348.1 AAA family ATPase [Mediterraneibacter gnavus]NSI46253.1 AAA family ATPase [Mediterraneibacter gnavus]